jgi:hypothetical protein
MKKKMAADASRCFELVYFFSVLSNLRRGRPGRFIAEVNSPNSTATQVINSHEIALRIREESFLFYLFQCLLVRF